MSRLNLLLTITAASLLAVGICGCNSPTSSTPSPAGSVEPDGDAGDDHAGHDHGEHATGEQTPMEKMTETLAKLPEADRVSAEKQHFCPVSGEMLGTMGLPLKVTADDQSAWICCEGCRDKFMADSATYLAKINKE